MSSRLVQVKCPRCGATEVFAAADVGQDVSCWSDPRVRFALRTDRPFGAADWDAARTPGPLRACLKPLRVTPRPRASAGFAVALVRAVYPKPRSRWLRKAAEYGEQFLRTGTVPHGELSEVLNALIDGQPPWLLPAWAQAGICCVSNYPLGWPLCGVFDVRYPRLVADLIREFAPNPFRPLTWNPGWVTATVHQLATHIDTADEFAALPILADALQDAGCDDEQVLAHCRADRPHARGCWVLDAVRAAP
jgi:hypothetical protein